MNRFRSILIFSSVCCLLFLYGCSNTGTTEETEQAYIEKTLDLANNAEQEWTYSQDSDAWVLSVVSAVAYPEIADKQGVSVCVPGAYVSGIDTNNDGSVDVDSKSYSESAKGSLIIDYEAEITSTNGQVYTASTAPVILNTGAAGYGSSTNSSASSQYANEGYINVSCGNRGKQDIAIDENGSTYYTGDAPSCLVDQKAAARYVKYNILLGNLPGGVDYFVSTGGSGGGAHAAMFAATSNNVDYYDYQIEAGAVGVYKNDDGTYSTSVTIDGTSYDISDGAWGCIAYSPITSLYEADMALAFEYYLDTTYGFNSSFQSELAQYLSESYMKYINEQGLSVNESDIGLDINKDGDTIDEVSLTIEYDPEAYPETNGYYGTYLDYYLAEFADNLQWYLDNLDYAEGWTWFNSEGEALSNEEVASMSSDERATAFLEGRYDKGASGGMMSGPGGSMGGFPSGTGGNTPNGTFDTPSGEASDDIPSENSGDVSSSEMPDSSEMSPDGPPDTSLGSDSGRNSNGMAVGTPDAGTTQSADATNDSNNYASYEEMLTSYESDIASIAEGDKYGNNIVDLYNPLNYIGAEGTENPTWTKILMGAAEGDISMFNSLNLQIAFLNAGVDAGLEWQWDGGHVPTEILGDSFSLYVDQMYGEHVEGSKTIEKQTSTIQSGNGTATEASGIDISSWVDSSDIKNVSFSLADAAAYRTKGASKAIPGFDVIDYGQEDYVFGNEDSDARHWSTYLLTVFQTHREELSALFNAG